jgi:hypothetical protein
LAITYHAGRRIQGTSTDATAVSGGWKELARTTLGSDGATISVTGLADKRYYMILIDSLNSGVVGHFGRLNGDSGGNYSRRRSEDGGSEQTNVNNVAMNYFGQDVSDGHAFTVGYLANKSDKEKLSITHSVWGNTAGAGNAPHRMEDFGKWNNTTDPISSYQVVNLANSNNFASGAECVVLGYDPDDTHTTNFWEELASVSADGSSSTLSSGTITAKKYLWLQFYSDNMGSGKIRFNSDTGSNYSRRYSANGGSDVTSTSLGYLPIGYTTTAILHNIFIVNNSANEKLCIIHDSERNTAGAGNAPYRMEEVGKWSNTSSQITQIDLTQNSNFASSSVLKIWGSD